MRYDRLDEQRKIIEKYIRKERRIERRSLARLVIGGLIAAPLACFDVHVPSSYGWSNEDAAIVNRAVDRTENGLMFIGLGYAATCLTRGRSIRKAREKEKKELIELWREPVIST